MKFNILTEPWIPVIFLSGERQELGLLDTLKYADRIVEIDLTNTLEEYGIYRFLILFLTCVYRPKKADDIIDILDSGKVDEKRIKEYLELCKKEGVSFDIFDKDRPFLQSPYDRRWDSPKKLKSPAELDYTKAHGNNTVHFDHTFEKDAIMTPPEAARALPAVQLFCMSETEGRGHHRPSNVYGPPPLFFLIRGKSLFETLVCSMVPLKENDGTPPEIWRCTDSVKPEKKVAKTSLLYGMLFPSRRVRLVEKDGIVRRVYFQSGLNFTSKSNWRDPQVAYRIQKSSKNADQPSYFSPLMPESEKEPWRNIGTLTENFPEEAPLILNQYQNYIAMEPGKEKMGLMLFGVCSINKAGYFQLQRGEIVLDTRITKSGEKSRLVSQAVKLAETDAFYLKRAIQDVYKNKEIKEKKEFHYDEIQSAERNFFAQCGKYFLQEFSGDLAKAQSEDEKNQVYGNWKKAVARFAKYSFNEFCRNAGIGGRLFIKEEMVRKGFYLKIEAKRRRNKKNG